MRLLVFGASGRTGRRVIAEALSRNLNVGAFVRDQSSLVALAGQNVEIHTGDVTDSAAVKAAVRENDVVISTLGGGSMAEGTRAIVTAMEAALVKRFLGVVGAGVLQWDAATKRNEQPSYPTQLRAIGSLHQRVHDVLARTALDWLLLCTPRIVDADATGQLVSKQDFLPDGSGAVTTSDLAALLVREAIEPKLARRVGVNGILNPESCL
jgi:putative NADH-flavin reductase